MTGAGLMKMMRTFKVGDFVRIKDGVHDDAMPPSRMGHLIAPYETIIHYTEKYKKRTEPIVEIHTSGSNPDISYKTRYYPDNDNYYCDCPGTWRAPGGKCKHIKKLEIKVNEQNNKQK